MAEFTFQPHQVVRTKIVPPLRRVGLLHRRRLIDFLHENLNRKLLLISAAPGYGKTSLLVDFMQDTDLPTCWYAMDDADADPWSFLWHLSASIMETFPQLQGGSLADSLRSTSPEASPKNHLQLLVNEISTRIPEYFLILLDDYQYADQSADVRELLLWFLDHQPDNCSLILATRGMPDLPYLKLAAKQEIAGLGSEDLAFTPSEIQDYLDLNHNLQIPPEEAERLAEETEGWITGILLSTQTLWKGLLRSLSEARGRDQQVFDYLAQEVYQRQSIQTQRFLRATSLLPTLEPQFCNALLDIEDSSDILEELEHANLFLSRLSSPEPIYRYHALFREFLQSRFAPDRLAEKKELHSRAAYLYQNRQDYELAIEHYLAAGAPAEAAVALKHVMEPLYRSGRLTTLRGWMEALENEVLEADAELLIMQGRLARQGGLFPKALKAFRRAESLYLEEQDPAGVADARVRRALVLRFQGDLPAARVICQEILERSDDYRIEPASLALAHRIIGECHHVAGDLAQAKNSFRRSLELYEKVGDDYHTASLLSALGTTARRMGNPLEAEGHYSRALTLMKSLGNRWRVAETMNNIGVGHYYQGEYREAQEILQEALDISQEVGHRRTEALVQASLGDLYAELGEHRTAQTHYQGSLEGARETGDMFLEVYVLGGMASLYRADRAWEQARNLLDQAEALAASEESGYMQGLIAYHRGLLALSEGVPDRAIERLQMACRQLGEAGAQRERIHALMWLANALYQVGQVEAAHQEVFQAMDLSRETAHPHLLVVAGSQMTSLLQSAADSQSEIAAPARDLLTRISQFKLTEPRLKAPSAAREIQAPALEARALGGMTVRLGGKAIPHIQWGGPLVRELFFFLLDQGPVRREVILSTFWPDYSIAKAKGVFHASLYRMRRVIPKDWILFDSDRDQYRIDQEADLWYDAAVFHQLLQAAEGGDPQKRDLLHQAVGIYGGNFLPEVYSDWAAPRRAELEAAYVSALYRLARLEREAGELKVAVRLLERAFREDPYREDLARTLMTYLAEDGRSGEAVRVYQRLEDRLREELDTPPAPETIRLQQDIRRRASR